LSRMMAERHLLDDPVSLKIILLAWRCSIRSSLSRRDRRTPKNTEGFKQPSRFGDMKCRNQCSFSSAHQLGKTMTPIGNSGLCWVRGGDGWRRQHSHTATCPPWLFGCLVVWLFWLFVCPPLHHKPTKPRPQAQAQAITCSTPLRATTSPLSPLATGTASVPSSLPEVCLSLDMAYVSVSVQESKAPGFIPLSDPRPRSTATCGFPPGRWDPIESILVSSWGISHHNGWESE